MTTMLARDELVQILRDIASARVAVVGDFALDVYWFVDSSHQERSAETGLEIRAVRKQTISPGGAANIAANLASLRCRKVDAYGVVGNDIWADELLRQLNSAGVNCTALLVQPESWSTNVYVKPHFDGVESNRLDLGPFNELSRDTGLRLLSRLADRLDHYDVIILNQQIPSGLHTLRFRAGVKAIMTSHPGSKFIVDSRDFVTEYPGAIVKINEREVLRLLSDEGSRQRPDALQSAVKMLFAKTGKPVVVTLGSRGSLVYDGSQVAVCPAEQIDKPIDTVGAGDTVLAAVAAVLSTGRDLVTAAAFGNLAAAVTIQKLGCTGTASPHEILAFIPAD